MYGSSKRMFVFITAPTLVLCFTGCLSKQPEYYTPYEPSGWTISHEPLEDYLKQPLQWGIYPHNEAVVFENETLKLALAFWPISRLIKFWELKHPSPLLLRMNVRAKKDVEIVCHRIYLSVPSKTTEKISPKSVDINRERQESCTMIRLSPGEEVALHMSYAYPGRFHNKHVFFLLIEGIYTNNSRVSIPVIRLNHVDVLN